MEARGLSMSMSPAVAERPQPKSQLLLESLIHQSESEEARQARVHALLVKFTAGHRLRAEELADIAHLVPIDQGRNAEPVKEGAYSRPYRDYVPVYKKSERSIKLYVAKGKERSDLPPLDQPAEMPAWWSRVMSDRQRCPTSITLAAQASATRGTPDPKASAPLPSPSPITTPPRQDPQPLQASLPTVSRMVPIVISTQEQDLQHLREDLARCREELLRAQIERPTETAAIEILQKKWRALRQETESAEEALFKLRSKQGRLVDVDEMSARLLPKLQTIAQGVWSMRSRLKPQLAVARSESEEDAIWRSAVDGLFAELVADGFIQRSPLVLDAT